MYVTKTNLWLISKSVSIPVILYSIYLYIKVKICSSELQFSDKIQY